MEKDTTGGPLFFPQIAFAIAILTSSLGVGDRDISQFVAWGGVT